MCISYPVSLVIYVCSPSPFKVSIASTIFFLPSRSFHIYIPTLLFKLSLSPLFLFYYSFPQLLFVAVIDGYSTYIYIYGAK